MLSLTRLRVGTAVQLSSAVGARAKAAVIPAALLHCRVWSNEPAVLFTVGASSSFTVTVEEQLTGAFVPSLMV